MSSIEGFFMIGICLGLFLFPAFNSETDPNVWLNVYWLWPAISLLSFSFFFTKRKANRNTWVDLLDDFKQMFKLFAKLLTIVL
jgi:purine-cytosine permease-like protein